MSRALLVTGALLVLLAVAVPADAAFPGANGKIAWSVGPYVRTINPDGTGETDFCDFGCFYSNFTDPGWSADGSKIAFVQDVESGEDIYKVEVANADFSSAHLIGGYGYSKNPAWSLDGTTIAIDGIGILDPNGTDPQARPQTLACCGNSQANWSPDGTKIVYHHADLSTGDSIWVMNADGSGQTNLSNGTTRESHPNWSPDGSKITFARSDGPGDDVWVMNADGSSQVNLTNDPTRWDNAPAWSPDGRQIAYLTSTVANPSPKSLAVMNADGSNSHVIATGGNGDVDWQPLPTASYEHPQSASQLNISIVPAFKQCGTGGNPSNASHAPPLSTGSCNPPQPGSAVARVGLASQSSAQFSVTPGDSDPTNGNQANVPISINLSDIQTSGGADYNPNPSGADLTAVTRLRFTDKANGYGGLPATATEYDFKVPVDCTSTADPSVGSTCTANTTANALVPGLIQEQRQTVVQAFRVRVDDSGANGIRGDSDDRIFATQGVFVP